MTTDIILALVIIGVAIVLFVTERFSVDTVAILVMTAFVVTGILTPAEGLSGFSNNATVTVGAMFVLSAAIFKSGVLNGLSRLLIRMGQRSYWQVLLALMLIAGSLSAFINDTAVVALLMPVTLQIARETDISPSRLLMPLSFGALLGGVCTLVGTSTNILVSGILEERGYDPLGMFEMSPAGLWFLVAGLLFMMTLGRRLLPHTSGPQTVKEAFEMNEYLAEIRLLPSAQSIGYTLGDSPLVKELDIEVLHIIRQDKRLVFPMPYTMLMEGDTLKVRCDINKVKRLAQREGILVKGDLGEMKGTQIYLYEFLVTPDSQFVGKSLAEIAFRDTYTGASVLAIRSRSGIIHEKIGRTVLRSGDTLLVRASRKMARTLRVSKNVLLLSEVNMEGLDPMKALWTLTLVAAAILTAALNILPIVSAAIAAVVLLVMTGILRTEEVYRAVEWKVIFLLAGVLSMGAALEKTGAAGLLAQGIESGLGHYGPHVVLSFFFGATFMLTNIMSNNATAALLVPIALLTSEAMGVHYLPYVMAITFAASLSFMTPIGYQTNTMIYVPGGYSFKDFLRIGTPLNLLLWLLATFMLPMVFPF
jgi:di/tricarboxylate transporter